MKRLHSFDVFDTLLTRTVAVPSHLFMVVGERLNAVGLTELSPAEFADARIEAEREARRRTATGEVGLAAIYRVLSDGLGWDEAAARRAQRIELELEELSLRVVPEMREKVERARREASRIIFLSDMYLPGDFIRERLRKEGFLKEDAELFLSNEIDLPKWTGGMYEKIRDEFNPDEWIHWGDHPKADGAVPRALDIRAEILDAARLNRYEWEACGTGMDLAFSRLAAAMRLARLDNPESTSRRRAIWDCSADIVGPLLFGFVYWCLEQAAANGIRRLYFVSRDGQILHRIAEKIVPAWGYGIECRYLYGSRQAWHPAAIQSLCSSDLEWILTPTKFLSLRRAFERLGVQPDSFADELERAGFPKTGWEEHMSETERSGLGELILQAPLKSGIEKEAGVKRALALNYFRQEKMMDGTPWAIVDIGWHGRLQDSLTKLFSAASAGDPGRMCGFYFGLVGGGVSLADQQRTGYWNYWGNRDWRIKRLNWAMMELFTTADHGQVIGYRREGSRFEPILMRPRNQEALDWGLLVQQAGVLRFVEHFLQLTRKEQINVRDFRATTEEIYNEFYTHPTRTEAETWGDFPFSDDQFATSEKVFLPIRRKSEANRAIWRRNLRPPFWWIEGSHAIAGGWLLLLYARLRWWWKTQGDAC